MRYKISSHAAAFMLLSHSDIFKMERLTYALISAVFGAVIGVVCWWLYGLGLSLNYTGPGMDPVLRHWLIWSSGAFGAIGFVLRERAADVVGDAISAIFHFEFNQTPGESKGILVALMLIAIIIAAIWFTAPRL